MCKLQALKAPKHARAADFSGEMVRQSARTSSARWFHPLTELGGAKMRGRSRGVRSAVWRLCPHTVCFQPAGTCHDVSTQEPTIQPTDKNARQKCRHLPDTNASSTPRQKSRDRCRSRLFCSRVTTRATSGGDDRQTTGYPGFLRNYCTLMDPFISAECPGKLQKNSYGPLPWILLTGKLTEVVSPPPITVVWAITRASSALT